MIKEANIYLFQGSPTEFKVGMTHSIARRQKELARRYDNRQWKLINGCWEFTPSGFTPVLVAVKTESCCASWYDHMEEEAWIAVMNLYAKPNSFQLMNETFKCVPAWLISLFQSEQKFAFCPKCGICKGETIFMCEENRRMVYSSPGFHTALCTHIRKNARTLVQIV